VLEFPALCAGQIGDRGCCLSRRNPSIGQISVGFWVKNIGALGEIYTTKGLNNEGGAKS
jgi:hypothetical protein